MATISITIADADLARVVSDICGFNGYQAQIPQPVGPPIDNPETQNQFARRMVLTTIRSWCVSYESQQAALVAAASATNSANQLGIT